jgi:hypothetical protein
MPVRAFLFFSILKFLIIFFKILFNYFSIPRLFFWTHFLEEARHHGEAVV